MSDFLLSQVIAAIAFALGIGSYQFASRRAILLWMSSSAIANACHFLVLGRPGPAALTLIGGYRSLVCIFTVNRKLMYLFFGLMLVGFFFLYKNPIGLLGLPANLLSTYGTFQKGHQKVRVFFMLSTALWLVHNILAGSPVAVLMEVTFLSSNMVGYWRFYSNDKVAPGQAQDLPEECTR